MLSYIKADLYRYTGQYKYIHLFRAWFIPGFRYTLILRVASFYRKYSFIGFISRVLARHYSFIYGYQIPIGTQIGPGLCILHWGNIVINSKVTIGKNCNISQGVTIGKTNRGRFKGTPCIGDQVFIGANAVIVGKINIGDNVLIAPNSFVNFDVPVNSIVIGNPAKIISRDNATEGYIKNLVF